MTLEELNALSHDDAVEALSRCCGAHKWAVHMARERPFASPEALYAQADAIWAELDREHWLEAFTHHPKIGDTDSLRKKFASTSAWAGSEQSGVATATEQTIEKLARGNQLYEQKFGYIFIVCATGKSAKQMLAMLERRLDNSPEDELAIAAAEQAKITRIRLEKLLK